MRISCRASWSEFDYNDVWTYLNGECPAYAIALHRKTGLPMGVLVMVGKHPNPPGQDPIYFDDTTYRTAQHAIVMKDDNTGIDATGEHSIDYLKKQIMDSASGSGFVTAPCDWVDLMTPVTEAQLKELFKNSQCTNINEETINYADNFREKITNKKPI